MLLLAAPPAVLMGVRGKERWIDKRVETPLFSDSLD